MPALDAPIAPAVGSPTPAPAAPAAPAAPETPASPTVETSSPTVMESFDKQFSDLDEPAKPETPPAEPVPPKAEAPGKKPEEPAKPAEPKKPAAPPEESAPPQSGATLAQVRAWGKRMADMATNATSKVKELTSQIEELKRAKPELPPDVAKIQADYQRLQKENQEHRERLNRADYSQSPEYEEQFRKPYHQAYMRGRQLVQALMVREKDGESEEIKTRQGTADDFDRLYQMSDSEADAAAEVMFGPSARRVIAIRDTAKERGEAAYNAIKEKTAQFAEEKTRTEAQKATQRLALQGLWTKVNEDLQTKHEKWFGDRDEDKEWNEAMAKGREIVGQRFTDAYSRLSPEQRVVLDAQIFNRASAFPAMKVLVARLEKQLEDANGTIAKLRGSGPGKPDVHAEEGGGAAGSTGNWEAEFDKRL